MHVNRLRAGWFLALHRRSLSPSRASARAALFILPFGKT
jgi:hypothetical protein